MNPHPPLTGFPFVLLVLILAAEVIQLFWPSEAQRRTILFLVTALLILSPITYYSGYWGLDYANQRFQVPVEFINQHQALAQGFLLSLIPFGVLSFIVNTSPAKVALRILYWLALVVSLTLVCVTAFKGGDLVFSHGAGVVAE